MKSNVDLVPHKGLKTLFYQNMGIKT